MSLPDAELDETAVSEGFMIQYLSASGLKLICTFLAELFNRAKSLMHMISGEQCAGAMHEKFLCWCPLLGDHEQFSVLKCSY